MAVYGASSGLGEVPWWLVRDGKKTPLINQGVRVEDLRRVHERTLRVLTHNPLYCVLR